MGLNLYEKVTQYIMERIESGKYKTGDQIPTENELASALGVSRPTVRHALGKLTTEGYLTRTKGRGTFVTKPKVVHQSTSFVASYRAEMQMHDRQVTTKVLDISVERLPDYAARSLNVPIGTKATKLVRVRSLDNYNDGNSVVYTTLYVPLKLFEDMSNVDEFDFASVSFYDLMDRKGLGIKHARRKLEVVVTPSLVASYMKISTFEPSIFITSVGFTGEGIAAEYSESYYPAGCSSFIIEVDR